MCIIILVCCVSLSCEKCECLIGNKYVMYRILSVESQKGDNAVQRFYVDFFF